MTRPAALIWMLVVVGAAFLLYVVKYQVQELQAQVRATSLELKAEREALTVVAAEWAYLNRPERLQRLADKYLHAAPLTVDRIAEAEAIPFRPGMQASAGPENIHSVSVGKDSVR